MHVYKWPINCTRTRRYARGIQDGYWGKGDGDVPDVPSPAGGTTAACRVDRRRRAECVVAVIAFVVADKVIGLAVVLLDRGDGHVAVAGVVDLAECGAGAVFALGGGEGERVGDGLAFGAVV